MSDVENFYKAMTRELEIKCIMNGTFRVTNLDELNSIDGMLFLQSLMLIIVSIPAEKMILLSKVLLIT